MGTGNLKSFSGRVANVVGYQLYGKDRLRSLPGSVHQTPATKQSARLFGKASKLGGLIRNKLVSLIPYPSDIKMQTRLSSSIFKWLKENYSVAAEPSDHLLFIEGCQFTDEGYTLAERFKLAFQVTNPSKGEIQINIPAFIPSQTTTAPSGTVSLLCDIVAVNCLFENPEVAESSSAQLSFDYNKNSVDAQTISLNLPTPPGSLLITAVSLKYMMPTQYGLQASTAKGYQPAAIVSAMSL